MFSHVVIGVLDFERSFAFYEPLMKVLGNDLRFRENTSRWAGWHSDGCSRPFFVVCTPFDGEPHQPGNGQMVAFTAASRGAVEVAYAVALAGGGKSEGGPGLRARYHPDYFAAYFRDPDGNKICVVCHEPVDGSQASG